MFPHEYPLYRSTTAVLQAVLKGVGWGYRFHHYGEVEASRVLPLVEKLDRNYRVLLEPPQQSLLKKLSYPTARLVLDHQPRPLGGQTRWPFVLLSTRPLEGERMFEIGDARHHPLVWRGIYQLYFTPWQHYSWRLADTHFAVLSQQIAEAARGRPGVLIRRLDGLCRYPRFHGVHQDVRRLVHLARKGWGSARRGQRHRSGMAQPDWVKYLSLRPLRGIGGKLYHEPPLTLGEWLEGKQEEALDLEAADAPVRDPEENEEVGS